MSSFRTIALLVFVASLLAAFTVNPVLAQLHTPPRNAMAAAAPVASPTAPPAKETAAVTPPVPPVANDPNPELVKQLTDAKVKIEVLEKRISTELTPALTRATVAEQNLLIEKQAAKDANATADEIFKGRRLFFRFAVGLGFLAILLADLYFYKPAKDASEKAILKERKNFKIVAVALLVIAIFFIAAPQYAGAAGFTCVNPATGTPGYPIAVVGVDNEIKCSVSGSAVEVKDESGAVVTTTGTPSSFKINPASGNVGRASISIDGKLVSILAIGEGTDASYGNIWLDMVRQMMATSSASSGTDIHVRLFLEGFVCKGDAACLAEMKKQAWGNGKGTSSAYGLAVRDELDAKADAAQAQAEAAAEKADAAQARADAAYARADAAHAGLTGGVSKTEVETIVKTATDPIKATAERAIAMGQKNNEATQAILEPASRGKKIGKKDATTQLDKLVRCASQTARGETCSEPMVNAIPATSKAPGTPAPAATPAPAPAGKGPLPTPNTAPMKPVPVPVK